ncbi:unnamed protein product [Brassica oleracea]|uniref:Glutaredoxin domain-containing protein n=3 Tax=Brassica TaxID=3705 RepID=A0A0D3B005_BRAOL|nr:PREDICTED: uncharacterized protein At5g39865-like [Brassica oleracea var. oleracea]CAF1696535.1 unnamed protein product [Brassica napus]VDC85451.1 unnamed protein product [Brassica oleracea]
MKGMKERLAKKIKLITIVSTLKQGLAHHRNNVDRTIHHLKEEIVVESGQSRGCVTPTLPELEDVDEQAQEHDLQEEERGILLEFEENCPPGGEDSIVFYTTGLRGVRKTFEACRRVRFLLENHKVMYKERDVSMDAEFRDEMWRLLGGKVTSPRLFIRGRYIGGADEVVALNENGKLKKLLEGISLVDSPCECCDNERFLICFSCNGSSKLIADHYDDEETSNDDNKMWTRCRECNENGLVKCPLCS